MRPGKIFSFDTREIRGGRFIVSFGIYDGTDSIICKIFVKADDVSNYEDKLKPGKFVKVKGNVSLDMYDRDVTMGHVDSHQCLFPRFHN